VPKLQRLHSVAKQSKIVFLLLLLLQRNPRDVDVLQKKKERRRTESVESIDSTKPVLLTTKVVRVVLGSA